jgi:hypothetical protein
MELVMSDYFFSVNVGNNRTLYIAPLTDRLIEQSGQDVIDPAGYFLFERQHCDGLGRVEILAQLISEEAAFRLRDMLAMT